MDDTEKFELCDRDIALAGEMMACLCSLMTALEEHAPAPKALLASTLDCLEVFMQKDPDDSLADLPDMGLLREFHCHLQSRLHGPPLKRGAPRLAPAPER